VGRESNSCITDEASRKRAKRVKWKSSKGIEKIREISEASKQEISEASKQEISEAR
jgi:hypothetical protein